MHRNPEPKPTRELNKRYLARVRRLPCCMCGMPGPSEAHHSTGAGLGTKANDTDTMPLCTNCHRCFHALTGPFTGWVKQRIRSWQARMVRVTRATLLPPVRKVF